MEQSKNRILTSSNPKQRQTVPKNTSPSNPHPPHSRAYDRYNKFLRGLEELPSALLDMRQNQTNELLWRDTGGILAGYWRDTGGILAGSTGECWQVAPAQYWPDTRQDPAARDTAAASTGELLCHTQIHWRAGELLCDTQRDIRRDPLAGWWDTRRDVLASYSGILSGIVGGIHWRAAGGILGGTHWRATLAGYSAGSTDKLLWDNQRDARRDPLAGALVGYSAGSTGWRDTQRDTRRDPLVGCSGEILGGIHWRADSRRSTGEPLALAGYCRSGGILGGIHWRAALAGYSAGSTGEPVWRDTRRDPLASRSGGILGHWQAALGGAVVV